MNEQLKNLVLGKPGVNLWDLPPWEKRPTKETEMSEAAFQISDKLDEGAIFLVRGNSYSEFVNNLGQVTDDENFTEGLNGFLTAVRAARPTTPSQAYAAVQQNLGAAPVQQQPMRQFAQQPTTAGTFTCDHGQRVEKSGNSAKGPWKAYFCPTKTPGCRPMNADGTFWK